MLLLGFDLETTGLDTKNDRAIELGAVLWDAKHQEPIEIYNTLIWEESFPQPSAEALRVNGIRMDILKQFGVLSSVAWNEYLRMQARADYIVAHNGTHFDFLIAREELLRSKGADFQIPPVACIDTSIDVPYPEHISTRKLVHLAAEHNFLNPFAHRALSDVLTMMKVLSQYPIEEVIRYAASPTVKIRAQVSMEEREKAKARGYRWNPERKIWHKTIKEFQLETERKEAPFKVIVLEGAVNV